MCLRSPSPVCRPASALPAGPCGGASSASTSSKSTSSPCSRSPAAKADDVAGLEELIARDGMVVAGSQGLPRLNAAVAEVRQGRLALGKLLGLLALPDEVDRPLTAASRTAKRAAEVRWNRKRLEQERRAARLADGPA